MEDLKVEPFNPWKVETIDWFLNYCCPECDFKEKTKAAFIMHATQAHPNSREYLPLFDKENLEPSKTEFDIVGPSVKLKPLSMNSLLKIECNEENCGRFFLTEEGMIEHKRQFHQKLTRKVKKLDYIEDIEPLETLEHEKITLPDDFYKEDDSDFVPNEDFNDVISEEETEKPEEKLPISNKRKLKRKVKKPMKLQIDYVTDIEPTDHLDVKLEEDTNKLHGLNEDSDLEAQEDSIDVIPEEYKENANLTKKRKLTDSDDEYGKPTCKKCDQQFPSQSAFNAHKKSAHSGEPKEAKKGRPAKHFQQIDPSDGKSKYKCEACGLFFNFTKGLLEHRRNNHSNEHQENQKCFLCANVVPPKLMGKHMSRNHANASGAYECNWCAKLFAKHNWEEFLYHLTKEHLVGDFRHKCDQCDKTFALKYQFEKHRKIQHTSNSSIICDKCGQEFRTQTYLRNHLKLVHNLYDIPKEDTIKKCDKCEIEFEKPENFNDHLKQCLVELKNFECKMCESQWVSHLSLWQHIAVDHKLIRHICDTCGHVSTTLWGLKKHQKLVHEKIYKYVCHLCAKPLNSNEKLNVHMINVHGIGERKFKCDQCDKSFATSNLLKNHFESHHAKKTLYQCEQCPKTFWMKSYLNTHVRRIHDKIRPHKCDICQQGFVYKRDVVSHKKQVHNIHE